MIKREEIEEFLYEVKSILLSTREKINNSSFKGEREIVTEADKLIESKFRAFVKERYGCRVFGEEEGGNIEEDIFIIDPIDGTHNFALGNPHFAVSIAYWGKNEKHGWIYAPMEGFLFYSDGESFYINGKKTRRRKKYLKEPAIATGLAYCRRNEEEEKQIISRLIDFTPEIRISSSAALDLAYLAAGFLNGYIERGLHAWDIAAGYIMCKSVGIDVLDWYGNIHNLKKDHVIAGEKEVIKVLLDITKSIDWKE